jgi:hypothetical protein
LLGQKDTLQAALTILARPATACDRRRRHRRRRACATGPQRLDKSFPLEDKALLGELQDRDGVLAECRNAISGEATNKK